MNVFGLRFMGVFWLGWLCGGAGYSAAEEPSALDVFRRRIEPILKSTRPSSCAECHLSGVDLKMYIRATQEETFAALRDAGLINPQAPAESKLLQFIARKPDRPSLVSEKVRGEELAAFRAWIEAAVQDPKLAAAKTSDPAIGPTVSDEIVRHARRDRVLQSFLDNVWSEVGRCAACHSPDRNQTQVKKFGAQVSWIKLRDPQATLDYLLEHDLIDCESPEKSLLLQKPAKLVDHGGGQKIMVGDRTYKQFRAFIEDYAASKAGKYRDARELPKPAREVGVVSDIWFKLTDVPAELDGQLLHVDIYRRDPQTKAWGTDRWATADRAIFGKGNLWQQHVCLTGPRDSERARQFAQSPALPPGVYRVVVSVDRTGRLQKDFRAELAASDVVGEVIVDSRWPAGYGSMTVATFPPLAK